MYLGERHGGDDHSVVYCQMAEEQDELTDGLQKMYQALEEERSTRLMQARVRVRVRACH